MLLKQLLFVAVLVALVVNITVVQGTVTHVIAILFIFYREKKKIM